MTDCYKTYNESYSKRMISLNECGEWNNFVPVIIESKIITEDIRYGNAYNLNQVIPFEDGPCFGITAYKGHNEGSDQQPYGGFDAQDIGSILTFGEVAVELYNGIATAGELARTDVYGNIVGNNVGDPNTYQLSNVTFQCDGYQGDIIKVQVTNAIPSKYSFGTFPLATVSSLEYNSFLPAGNPFAEPSIGSLSDLEIFETGNPITGMLFGTTDNVAFTITLQSPTFALGILTIGPYSIGYDFNGANVFYGQLTADMQTYFAQHLTSNISVAAVPTDYDTVTISEYVYEDPNSKSVETAFVYTNQEYVDSQGYTYISGSLGEISNRDLLASGNLIEFISPTANSYVTILFTSVVPSGDYTLTLGDQIATVNVDGTTNRLRFDSATLADYVITKLDQPLKISLTTI